MKKLIATWIKGLMCGGHRNILTVINGGLITLCCITQKTQHNSCKYLWWIQSLDHGCVVWIELFQSFFSASSWSLRIWKTTVHLNLQQYNATTLGWPDAQNPTVLYPSQMWRLSLASARILCMSQDVPGPDGPAPSQDRC